MKLTLNDIIDDMLSVDRKEEPRNVSLFERLRDFPKRREIEKDLQDEIANDNAKVLKLGQEAKSFMSSGWYKDLIEPNLKNTIKGGLQAIIRDSDSMTETQIRTELARIRHALQIVASLKLKVIQAEHLKETNAGR